MSDTIIDKIKPCALDKPYIFISYSAIDSEIVYRDVYELQLRGWNVWLDERNLDKTKPSWTLDALKAIEGIYCELGLFYVSEHSLCSENCYREMAHTDALITMTNHVNKPVKFIAVEVEEIGDIVEYGERLTSRLKRSSLPLEEREKRIQNIAKFLREKFEGNNERVRIKPCSTFRSEEDYYKSMEEQFFKSDLYRIGEDKHGKLKAYKQAIARMQSAKTENDYVSLAKTFRSFIDSIGNDIEFTEELQDARDREKQCLKKAEDSRNDATYAKALETMKKGTVEGYSEAIGIFRKIPEWKDSYGKIEECQSLIYQKATGLFRQSRTKEDYAKAAKWYEMLHDYRDSQELAQSCREKGEIARKDSIYEKAIEEMDSDTVEGYSSAINLFKKIPGWRDADVKAQDSQKYIDSILEQRYSNVKRELSKAKTYNQFKSLVADFKSLNGYKDAKELASHCDAMASVLRGHKQHNHIRTVIEAILAIAMLVVGFMSAWTIKKPAEVVKEVPVIMTEEEYERRQVLLAAKVGDTVPFGRYEQDNDESTTDEPIEWIVLEKGEDGTLLLVSKYALEARPYNTEYTAITWEGCTLREWLNGEFYEEAFDNMEKAMIQESTNANEDNKDYGTKGGNATEDRVFLLSLGEAEKYFGSAEERECNATGHTLSGIQKAYEKHGWDNFEERYGNDPRCAWWLRSPGDYCDFVGDLYASGNIVGSDYVGVRPACRLNP